MGWQQLEQRQLGSSGLRVSAIGLGTMTWGRDTDEHEAAEQLRIFTESGGTFIDTAASYCDGDSERVIGGLIGTMIPREDVVIATKAGIVGREIDNSRGALLRDLDESLKDCTQLMSIYGRYTHGIRLYELKKLFLPWILQLTLVGLDT